MGQLKRQENCYSERISDNEIIVTHIFDVTSHRFNWDTLGSNEIPIANITLHPVYDIKAPETYDFKIVFSFNL